MSSWKIWRISALLTTLVLVVGVATHGLGVPEPTLKSATASDMPMPGKCNGCAGDEKGATPAACSAFCGTVIAVPLVTVVFDAVPAETLNPTVAPDAIGRAEPPDPYPPRPTILS